jgi:hypothetical protein
MCTLPRSPSWPRLFVSRRLTARRDFGMFEADRDSSVRRWPVVRLSANSQTRVTLLSSQFFALTTHYYTVTVPCPGDNCDLCDMIASRGLFYLAVMCAQRVSILELGAHSASHLEQHLKLLHGGMVPGHVLELTRRGKKHPIHSTCVETVSVGGSVTHRDLVTHVMSIYKFPCPNPDDTLEAYEARCRTIAVSRNKRVVDAIKSGKSLRV